MKCISCKSENLFGNVKADILLPLAKKGGNVITAGSVVTQKMVESWWLQRGEVDQLILGPIFCSDCSAEHTYFKGLTPALRLVEYREAMQYGYNHYATGTAAKAEDDDATE